MFSCKLCEGRLSSKQPILGTYCGHIFHQECLEQYLSNTSTLCPTCDKSLRVDLPTTASDYSYAVLPLYPEEGSDHEADEELLRVEHLKIKNAVIHENTLLRSKLVEVCQALLTIQNQPLLVTSEDARGDTNHEKEEIRRSSNLNKHFAVQQSKENILKSHNEFSSHVTTDNNVHGLNHDLDTKNQKIEQLDSKNDEIKRLDLMSPELDKARILRSKRREYLTLRNKTQSWLDKMELGTDRLIKMETSFSPFEYLEEVRHFFNKIYNQGGIVDAVKEAAVVYLIVDEVPDKERDEIQRKIHELMKSYERMMTRVIDKLDDLEGSRASKSDSQPAETPSMLEEYFRSISDSSMEHYDRCSSLSEGDGTSQVSTRPASNLISLFQEQDKNDLVLRDAVFV